mmetsp:Transcript_38806/g.109805  ORF Transcript_38806/g.109805 Transcript_38806/m.109805 type:complete len:237 (-) Transcript_38806:1339-2049(-)
MSLKHFLPGGKLRAVLPPEARLVDGGPGRLDCLLVLLYLPFAFLLLAGKKGGLLLFLGFHLRLTGLLHLLLLSLLRILMGFGILLCLPLLLPLGGLLPLPFVLLDLHLPLALALCLNLLLALSVHPLQIEFHAHVRGRTGSRRGSLGLSARGVAGAASDSPDEASPSRRAVLGDADCAACRWVLRRGVDLSSDSYGGLAERLLHGAGLVAGNRVAAAAGAAAPANGTALHSQAQAA